MNIDVKCRNETIFVLHLRMSFNRNHFGISKIFLVSYVLAIIQVSPGMWVGMDSDFNIDGNISLEILDTKTDSELVENFPNLTY